MALDDILSALRGQNSPFKGMFGQDQTNTTPIASPDMHTMGMGDPMASIPGQGVLGMPGAQPINPDIWRTTQELQQRGHMAGQNLQNANDALINPSKNIQSPWQGVSLLANKAANTGALHKLYGQLSGANRAGANNQAGQFSLPPAPPTLNGWTPQ